MVIVGRDTSQAKSERDPLPLRSVLFLVLGFAVLAPVCLYIWMNLLIPYYAGFVGHVSAGILRVLGVAVDSVRVESGGVWNSHTKLYLSENDFAFALLTLNIAPYVALILASPGLGLARRAIVLAIGVLILSVCHVAFVVLAFYYRDSLREANQVPVAIGQLFITLPFLLWLVLAYWDKLLALVNLAGQADTEADAGE